MAPSRFVCLAAFLWYLVYLRGCGGAFCLESSMKDDLYIPVELIRRHGVRQAFAISVLFEHPSEFKRPELSGKNIKNLLKSGVFEKRSPEESLCLLKTLKKKVCCSWCNKKTWLLVDHHYPVPKCKGGKSIVKICPSCHQMFHFIEHRLPKLNKQYHKFFRPRKDK